jgi:fructokinase
MFLLCGEALYDIFFDASDNPADIKMNACAGGSPFNVAVGMARLGQSSALLTGLSNDELGHRLAQLLENESVSTDYLLRTDRPTTLSLVGVNESGQPEYTFYGSNSADCGVEKEDLPTLGDDLVGLHFGSYSLVVKPVADAFAHLVENAGGRFISLDPNVRPTIEGDMDTWRERIEHFASHADLLKISAEDMDYLYPGEPAERRIDHWISQGVELVVVTDGGDDVRAWTRSGLQCRIRPVVSKVVDTVGAGDTFQAALLMQLVQGGDPKQAVRQLDQQGLQDLIGFAAKAASITCSRKGADLPRIGDL